MSVAILNNLPEDQYIVLNSVKIHYWSIGKGEPVILLHGGNSCIEIWTFNLNELAKHYRVYAFDMVGSGLSDKPVASYSLDYQVGFLQSFMDELRIERATLIGNSMGGCIALKFALQFPARVNKLVLISSLGLGREHAFINRILATFPAIANSSQPSRQGAKVILSSCVYNSKKSLPPEWIELSYQFFKLPGKKQAIISLLRSNFNLWGLKSEIFKPIVNNLPQITPPTLIFWGKQDRVIPVKHAYLASKLLPHSRLHIFNHCGHWAQVEYALEFNQLTLEFLHTA